MELWNYTGVSAPMVVIQHYEIRTFSGERLETIEVVHFTDAAALRAAKLFAEGKPYEVWKGSACIIAAKGSRKRT